MNTCPVCKERSRDGLTCWTCLRRTRRDLTELPWLYLETRHTALGMARMGRPNGSRSTDNPLRLNLHATTLADRVRAGIVGWTRIAIDRGAAWPAGGFTPMCTLIADQLRDLRHHEAFPELAGDVTRWTNDMVRAINLPPTRRIQVGPCPLDWTDTDGTTNRCQGIVWATFPRDNDGPPVHAACSWCCDPDAEPMIGLWVSEQWRTLGRLIERRREAADTARALAQAIGAAR